MVEHIQRGAVLGDQPIRGHFRHSRAKLHIHIAERSIRDGRPFHTGRFRVQARGFGRPGRVDRAPKQQQQEQPWFRLGDHIVLGVDPTEHVGDGDTALGGDVRLGVRRAHGPDSGALKHNPVHPTLVHVRVPGSAARANGAARRVVLRGRFLRAGLVGEAVGLGNEHGSLWPGAADSPMAESRRGLRNSSRSGLRIPSETDPT